MDFVFDLGEMTGIPLSVDAKHGRWIFECGFVPGLEGREAEAGTNKGVAVYDVNPGDA